MKEKKIVDYVVVLERIATRQRTIQKINSTEKTAASFTQKDYNIKDYHK